MLKGKSVVVTGSTSGHRLAIWRAFAKEGANLTINGFGEQPRSRRARRHRDGVRVKAIYYASRT